MSLTVVVLPHELHLLCPGARSCQMRSIYVHCKSHCQQSRLAAARIAQTQGRTDHDHCPGCIVDSGLNRCRCPVMQWSKDMHCEGALSIQYYRLLIALTSVVDELLDWDIRCRCDNRSTRCLIRGQCHLAYACCIPTKTYMVLPIYTPHMVRSSFRPSRP